MTALPAAATTVRVPLTWVRAVSALAVVGAALSLVFLRDYAAWILHRPAVEVRAADLTVIGGTVGVRAAISLATWRSLRRSGGSERLDRWPGAGGRRARWAVALAAVITVVGYGALALTHPPVWLVGVRVAQALCGVAGLVGVGWSRQA